MTKPEPPKDPMTALVEGAVQMHEIFKSYVEAGFTEDQALKLIAYIIAAGIHPNE